MLYAGTVIWLLAGCGEWKLDSDLDGDGFTKEDGDCWDNPVGPLGQDGPSGAEINPGQEEAWYSGVDEDCDPATADGDQDGDGYWVIDYRGLTGVDAPVGAVTTDCNDEDAAVNPGVDPSADAWYDGIDQDCAGNDDWDQDYDGFPCSEVPDSEGSCEGDCDDTDPQRYPDDAIPETWYDGIDQNCDGHSDFDQDFDGYDISSSGGDDCNDENELVNPGVPEDCLTEDDDDCNGELNQQDAENATLYYTDVDGDQYGTGDGELWCEPTGTLTALEGGDCNDGDVTISPIAQEVCDSLDTDEDCDGSADDADSSVDSGSFSLFYADADGDLYGDPNSEQAACDAPFGYVADATDCDDSAFIVNPGSTEICDGSDLDEDCNGLADDADPNVDTSTYSTFYADDDGDGYGNPDTLVSSCDPFLGATTDGTDCDDTRADVNPGMIEVCDSLDTDEDCDGSIDDGDPTASGKTALYLDNDGDGFGAGSSVSWCDAPSNYLSDNSDCDDSNSAINPAATEICDAGNTDEDCTGTADDADAGTDPDTFLEYFEDGDGDGYGSPSASVIQCDAPSGYGFDDQDCDDGDPSVNPGATEFCDGVDNNCADGIDEDSAVDASNWYVDADSDGYGNENGVAQVHCDQPSGYVLDNTDCHDGDPDISPGDAEICDAGNTDEDCDGNADDDDVNSAPSNRTTFYRDADSDGYGTNTTTQTLCDVPTGYVSVGGDCDDTSSARSPGLTEVCDGLNTDEDCDGLADDNDTNSTPSNRTTFYRDADSDSYGTPNTTSVKCDAPSGYVSNDDDCDDSLNTVKPGVQETCSTAYDDDCDGLANDNDPGVVDQTSWYGDDDTDGYGAGTATTSCDSPGAGYVANNDDCDDANLYVYPGATEYCDGVMNDCDFSGTWTKDEEDGLVTYISGGSYSAISTSLWPNSGATVKTYSLPADGTINVCEGTYPVKLAVGTSSSVIVKGIWGAAATSLDISVQQTGSVVTVGYTTGTITQSVVIDGLTLTGGIGTGSTNNRIGGGVYVYAPTANPTNPQLTIKNSIISGNTAARGGGIMVGQWTGSGPIYGHVKVEDSIITDNTATAGATDLYGGGVALRYGKLTCDNTDITLNVASSLAGGGGAIWLKESASEVDASAGCYLGGSNSDDNTPDDIDGTNFAASYNSSDDPDFFTCDGAGCL